MSRKILSICQLDLRSLACFRIGLGLIILWNFLKRFNSITSNYSDQGVLTRSQAIANLPREYWSLNFITGSVLGQQILFLFALLAALVLLIGYRTKLATIVCWMMLLSLHNRHLDVVSSSQDILRIITFWSIFIPLGAYYSCDRALDTNSKSPPQKIASGGTLNFIVQTSIIAIYLFSSSQLDTRFLCLVGLAFIPSYIWNWLFKRVYTRQIAGLTINYDRDCGFCKKVVCFLRTWLIFPGVTIREAQANPSICADMERHNSWVIEDYQGKRYFKWHGIVYVVSISPIFWWLAPILRIKPLLNLGNKIYETIANNRRLMGNFTKPFVFRQQTFEPALFLSILVILFGSIAIWGNLQISPPLARENNLDNIITQTVNILRLDLPEKSP